MTARKARRSARSDDASAAEAPTPRRSNSVAAQSSTPFSKAYLAERTGVPAEETTQGKIDPKKLAEATGVPITGPRKPREQQ